jgi:hypothetical protein
VSALLGPVLTQGGNPVLSAGALAYDNAQSTFHRRRSVAKKHLRVSFVKAEVLPLRRDGSVHNSYVHDEVQGMCCLKSEQDAAAAVHSPVSVHQERQYPCRCAESMHKAAVHQQ